MSRPLLPAGHRRPAAPTTTTPIVKPKACTACRTRKVKCDRGIPCANCARWTVRCIYPSPVRRCSRRRHQPRISGSGSVPVPVPVPSNLCNAVDDVSATHHITVCDWTCGPGMRTRTCWQYFTERVDPVVKILHLPSAEGVLRRSVHGAKRLAGGEAALVDAVYFSSVASMTSSEAQDILNESKDTALATHRLSLEHALLNIDDDLIALQALVLFLSINRLTGSAEIAWKLTGLAKRSAVFTKDLTPFDHEMRTRIRWQLWYLDHRAAKDLGQDDDNTSTRHPQDLPLNLNDSDLDPSSKSIPPSRPGLTEQTFALARYEIAQTRQKLNSSLPIHENQQTIEKCQSHIEKNYLSHCTDPTSPIQWLTTHVSHVLIMEMYFELYSADTIPLPSPSPSSLQTPDPDPNPEPQYSQRTQDNLFLLAIDIVDTSSRLKTSPPARQWAWLLTGYKQFRPLAFLLNELRYREECEAVEHAWEVVEGAFGRWSEEVRESGNGGVLDELVERAARRRERERV